MRDIPSAILNKSGRRLYVPVTTALDTALRIRQHRDAVFTYESLSQFRGHVVHCYIRVSLKSHACAYCGGVRGNLTKDHVMPKCLGYGDAGNILLACYGCNKAKGSRTLGQWMASMDVDEFKAMIVHVNKALQKHTLISEVYLDWTKYFNPQDIIKK